MSPSNDPEHIAISKSGGIKIDWKDGHHSDYPLLYLRDKCPCAGCTGAHGTPPRQAEAANPLQMYKPVLKMLGAEQVGNYAIRINGATATTPAFTPTSIFGKSASAASARRRADGRA